MRIMVVGSGAREHALCWRLARDPGVDGVVCAPGNAGIARQFQTFPVDATDAEALLALAEREQIDLTVVGPEAVLARGIADLFSARGRPVFGPRQAAARLETSKGFAKAFMARHGVPTARFRVCTDPETALGIIRSGELGTPVIKVDGLAGGKGVVVASSGAQAEAAVAAAMTDRAFGDAGATVVLEERLEGPEVSFFVVADGEHAVPLASAQDHKRIHDDDRGPNTGGMGAFSPSPLVDPATQSRIMREVVEPVLHGLIVEGTPYRGVLYCGLMLTSAGPKVIEFNVRFGDPEAQVVLPAIDEPLTPVLWAAATGVLRSSAVRTSSDRYVGIVLAAAGYPGDVRTGDVVDGLDALTRECPDVLVFHGGVNTTSSGELVTAGGRVMTVVGRGPTFAAAVDRAYDAVAHLRFAGQQYRRDIGRRAVEAERL